MSSHHPPIARKCFHSNERHGVTWTDEYTWLRDPNYPDVQEPEIIKYLQDENAYLENWLASRHDQIQAIGDELRSRINKEDKSVPVLDGAFEYYWKFEHDAQYRAWMRFAKGHPGTETIVLDENIQAQGKDYFRLRSLAVSRNGHKLAYATDTDGSERYVIRLKDLRDQSDSHIEVKNCSGSIVWDNATSAIFYVELNENLRPFRVRHYDISNVTDTVVFEESDPGFFVSIAATSDRSYMIIYTGDHVTREAHYVSLDHAKPEKRPINSRKHGHRLSVDHAHGQFYILTNDRHENFRLVSVSDDKVCKREWIEIIPGSDQYYLIDVDCFADFMVISEKVDGQGQLVIQDYAGTRHRICFDTDVFAAHLGDNREFSTDRIRVAMSSPITPATIFDYVVADRKLIVRKIQEIPSGYRQSDYRTKRIWASSHDGAKVPITLVHHKDATANGRASLLLYGYGAYGSGTEPSFDANRLSLLNRGIVYAIAHVRGGDEMGYAWYESGKLAAKPNSFLDFIACAEELIEKGYGSAGDIAIVGASAGGMLVGAALNMRPDLWGAVVARVPFVDVLNTMLDDSLPLTPIEWPEWGNPIESKTDFELIQSYSPYDNIKETEYPPILVTAGISDPRVTYWEPAKWVAKLRQNNSGDNPIYLKTNMGAGHFGVSGRYSALDELAQVYMFIVENLENTTDDLTSLS